MSEFFIGGLELRSGLELQSTSMASTSPSTAMLDSGATASAAPEAVVQSLVTAVLSQDRQAHIELDQASRPYFRFGNGKWGRALCRVTLQSRASGHLRSFSLYTLPNPVEYYQSQFDKSSLVPILIGMDFIGPEGVGMMIDFTTGLAMYTKEPSPEIFQLAVNAKGHYTLDIVQYLTRGNKCEEGHAHVVVRDGCQSPSTPMSHQMLELWTVWIDLQTSDRHLQERELSVARDRVWSLYQRAQTLTSTAAASAQMLSPSDSIAPTTSSPRSLRDGNSLARSDEGGRSGGGGNLGCLGQSQGEGQNQASLTGQDSNHEARSSRSPVEPEAVAMLRSAQSGSSIEQSTRPMDSLPALRLETSVHTSEGLSIEHDGCDESRHGVPHAEGPPRDLGRHQTHGKDLSPHDGQDHSRGGPPKGGDRASTSGLVPSRLHVNFPGEHDVGNGDRGLRPGTDSGLRAGERQAAVKLQPRTRTQPTPIYIGKKIMAMTTMLTAATSTLLLGLHLSDRDCLWEISCGPHSWLSLASSEVGMSTFQVNLSNGFDLYQKETWRRLRSLRKERRPMKMWFSLPFSKWCSWSTLSYQGTAGHERLATARRKERRLLWEVNSFVKEALENDPNLQIYFEWPWPCFGWQQYPMQDLQEYMADHGIPWLSCRVDGCNYGLRDATTNQFVKRPWLIRTTDEQFHRAFRAKVCPGNHGVHAECSSHENSYYPWRMVQSIAQHWRGQLTPSRHHQLLSLRHWWFGMVVSHLQPPCHIKCLSCGPCG